MTNNVKFSFTKIYRYPKRHFVLTLSPECIHNTIPKKKKRRKESLILRLPHHQKCCVLCSFGSFQRSSKQTLTLFFSSVWKSLEIAGMFSLIPIMTRQKSHAFDSEKVGSYVAVKVWNNLDESIKHLPLKSFKNKVMSKILQFYCS